MITEETIARVKSSLQATKSFVTLEVIEHLESQIDCYKALDSHYDEIEEDSKVIAKENAELKADWEEAKRKGVELLKLRALRIKELAKENAELKADKEWLDKVNNEQTEVILKMNEQIEKIKKELPAWQINKIFGVNNGN